MASHAISAPSRQLDEFEQLVYGYTGRMGINEEVSSMRNHSLDILHRTPICAPL